MAFTELEPDSNPVPSRRLWFGFATSAIAWVMLGCLDLCINWRACTHQEDYGIPNPHPEVRFLISGLAIFLLIVALTAGITSYRNWRELSVQSDILDAEAVERREFMAVLGVIVSITMGMGILWLSIPPFFLDICWRSR
jgi:hypothetical protein